MRSVPIAKELYDEILKNVGDYSRHVVKHLNVLLQKQELTYQWANVPNVLRHTFASHFMMNGGNILVLKEILGHSDIKMTMIYAHFAPKHLEDAVAKNPLTMLSSTK